MVEAASTPITAPLLRVSRPVSACSRCRSAKVRCDGKLPACTACERAGKGNECTGGSDQFARGKERSYIASLESRLEKLEKRLAALDARQAPGGGDHTVEQALSPHSSPPSTAHQSPGSPASVKSSKKKHVDSGEIEGLVADLGYMAINAVTRDFYGFTSQISFGRVALKASSVPGALDGVLEAKLPPRHTATQLVQHYFDRIFITLPCLNEASFFGAVESVYRDENSAAAFDVFCVYMVLAVGTMSLSRSKDSTAAINAARFVKAALRHVDSIITPSEIKGVQATLLLVQYSMLEPAHFNSWYLIGVASRIMIDIGLHQEPLDLSKKKPGDMDLRRRIFYCVYTLDRSISMVLQRPFTFSDDSVSVTLPRIEDPVLTERLRSPGALTSMAAAVHLFKLRLLQSDFYQTVHLCGDQPLENPNDFLREHTTKLRRWREEIPSSVNQFTRDWLLLEWHYLNVYVVAPSPRIPHPSPVAMAQLYSHCISYHVTFRSILKDSHSSRFVYTYHDALRTYFVGSNLLHALYHAEESILPPTVTQKELEKAADGIRAIVYVLTTMIVRWPDVEALRDKFRSQADYILAKLRARVEHIVYAEQQETTLRRQRQQQQQQQNQQLQSFGYDWPNHPMSGFVNSHVATPGLGTVAFYRYS